ncbi:MAG: nicotinate-nucleotide diphosphorylase (carboxylating) [Candidatus Omnitrophica bacterium CG1_02_49_16]|nr:MAG: nicotinate-nucleotide diphosphorylase (carboxylating) [Candidatus Omnitrophica bacterium CG1_02_49_16]
MLKTALIDPLVKIALKEDIGAKDITTSALIPSHMAIKAEIEFRQSGVLCGIEVAERVFRLVDDNLRFLPVAKDGEWVEKGREVAYIEGLGASILIAERTALNLLGHLSGIATKTKEFVDKVQGIEIKIMDTRKTTPGLRIFEKYAVKIGGGVNHRFGLYDQVLIKDNHLRILRQEPFTDMIDRAKQAVLKKTIIGVEVKNLMELKEALKSKTDYVLLDNMTVDMVRAAVAHRNKIKSKIELEVSGNVNLDNVRGYAETGVERISIGALTHAASSVDISLDIVGSS